MPIQNIPNLYSWEITGFNYQKQENEPGLWAILDITFQDPEKGVKVIRFINPQDLKKMDYTVFTGVVGWRIEDISSRGWDKASILFSCAEQDSELAFYAEKFIEL